jgi:hypothetical protein
MQFAKFVDNSIDEHVSLDLGRDSYWRVDRILARSDQRACFALGKNARKVGCGVVVLIKELAVGGVGVEQDDPGASHGSGWHVVKHFDAFLFGLGTGCRTRLAD